MGQSECAGAIQAQMGGLLYMPAQYNFSYLMLLLLLLLRERAATHSAYAMAHKWINGEKQNASRHRWIELLSNKECAWLMFIYYKFDLQIIRARKYIFCPPAKSFGTEMMEIYHWQKHTISAKWFSAVHLCANHRNAGITIRSRALKLMVSHPRLLVQGRYCVCSTRRNLNTLL